MENEIVVKEPLTTEQPSEGTYSPVSPEEHTPANPAGSKTDSELLLISLKEEREKRRLESERANLLEQELEQLKSSTLPDEAFSDEGKLLESKISSLGKDLSDVRSELAKSKLISTNPIFKEKWSEFEEFHAHPDNKGMNLNTAAKAFLVENGLLEPTRKGLEQPTGGTRTPLTTGMTAEDIKTLRETNYKKYQEMVIKGLIKIES